jgi:hypothetical protein
MMPGRAHDDLRARQVGHSQRYLRLSRFLWMLEEEEHTKKGVSGLLMHWIAMMFHSTDHHN